MAGRGKYFTQGCLLFLAPSVGWRTLTTARISTTLSCLKSMRLYCGQCTLQLTSTPLKAVEAKSVCPVDGGELMHADQIMEAPHFGFQFGVPVTHYVGTECLLLDDHEDGSRLQGCCGPSATSKYNQVCSKCKHEIGIPYADCIGPHFTAINMERLDTQPKW